MSAKEREAAGRQPAERPAEARPAEARPAEARPAEARPTVGLLLASIHRGSSAFLWPGVAAEAERADANLFCFPGGQLNAGGEWEAQRNAVYDLVGPESLDGLISWASSLGGSVDPQALLAFHRDLPSLPLVTIGWSPGGSPSVTVDTYRGMQELLRHLIEEHGYRTLAFIRGPRTHVSADERFQAYLDVLSRCGIERRDELISDPLPWEAGEEGVRQLVDRRGLRPGRDFQALAAASDLLIFDAVRTLQSRGFRVPEDLAAVGFNNITESRLLSPAVTTVAVPFREQGVRAFRLLQGMLRGGGPARSVRLPTRLVIRESCGCPSARLRLAAEGPVGRGASGLGTPGQGAREGAGARASIARADIAREGAALLGDGAAGDGAAEGGGEGRRALIGPLVAAFLREVAVREVATGGHASGGHASGEVAPSGGAFLPLLRDALERVIHAGGAVPPWQDLVSVLRRRALASPLKDAAGVEGLCSQARVMISEAVERSATLRAWAAAQRDQQLRELGKQLLMTLDLRRLGDVLRESLPRLGIASGYLAVYSDSWDRPRLARLLLGFTEEGWVIDREDPPVFPVRQLVPRRFLPRSRRYTYLVLPLFHQDQPLGYAVLEAAASSLQGSFYEELRAYLGSALKGAMLFDQARRAREEAEQAGQLKSRLLANVSHELREPLTAILGRVSDSLRRDREEGAAMPHRLREDLYHIQAHAERQLRVTGDLLDMSRAAIERLHLSMSVIDPRPVLEEGFRAAAAAGLAGPGVLWELDLPPRLPRLLADRSRLAQVLRELLDSAARRTRRGRLRLAAAVDLPFLHLSVSDGGPGLSRQQQERLFEPFAGDPLPSGAVLGLPLARQLVMLHAGALEVESGPGQGATFHVRFPLPNLSGSPPAPPERRAPALLVVCGEERPGAEARAIGAELERIAERCGCALRRVRAGAGWEAGLGDCSPAALAWDMDRRSPGDWALIRALRHHPLLFEVPFLLYGAAAQRESGTLSELIDTACPAPSTGPVAILSADLGFREHYSRIVERGLEGFAVRCLAAAEEVPPLPGQEPPSLLIVDAAGEHGAPALLGRLRRDERLQRVPALLLSGEPLRPDDAAALDGCARVALLNRDILTDAETLRLVRRLLFLPKGSSPFGGSLARRAVAWLNLNYRRPVARWQLAEAVSVSEDHLTRVFRRELGLSPWTYLNRWRIDRARLLLSLGEASVQEVSAGCGFHDQAYFCRVFRRLTGTTPLEYRRQSRR